MLLYTRKSIERERRNKNNEQKGDFRKCGNTLFFDMQILGMVRNIAFVIFNYL